jgi:hypothetical protein
MNDEQIRARLEEMKLEPGMTQEKMNAFVREARAAREENKGPTLDADGIEVDSYVNNTFWDSTGIDRDSYFDEEGNFVEKLPSFSAQPDLGYEQVVKELSMKELLYRDATMVEETSTERSYNVTEEDEGDFERSAETTYQDYIDIHNPIEEVNYFYHEQESLDANGNVTKKLTRTDTYGDQKMATEIDRGTAYLHEGMNVVPGETPIERENRLIELWTTMGDDMAAGRRGKPTAFANQAVDGEGYAGWRLRKAKDTSDSMHDPLLASNIYSGYTDGESEYFAEKIMIAKQQYAADNDGEKIEEAVGPNNINDPKFADLKSIFDGISLDDPRLKAAVVSKEGRGIRSNFIKDQASELAVSLDDEGGMAGFTGVGTGATFGTSLLFDWVFGDSKAKEEVSGKSDEDFQKIEEATRKKGIEAGLIHAHYNEKHEDFTATVKKLEGYGDAKEYIESIKSKHDLTTDEGIAAANVEITDFIDTYTGLVSDYNSGLNAVKDASLAATQIQKELGDLSIREQDLAAFTDQISKNHRTATQMALAFGNATVDLAQGAGDFVYMVNPLGALADELIDYAGEDSFLGTVVEVARYATAPVTGGISLYSGGRRDDIKEAIDGYQEHVSSLVAEPPRYEDIQNAGDAIEWALITGASQAPQLALLAASGGSAGLIMMGAMAAGQKFSDMESQRDLYQKTAGLYGQDHSFATMYAASMGSGAIETLSERVTLGLMKGGGGMISNALLKESGKKTMGSFFRRNVFSGDALKYSTKKLIDVGEEGGSEVLATMGGNYIDRLTGDKTVNILSGVEESFVTGALIGSTISMPSVFRDIHSSFKSVEAADILNANYAKIQEQNAIINDAESSQSAKNTAQELIGELVAQNAEAIAIDVKRVDSLNDAEKKRLVEIETENRKLIEQYSEVVESDMSEADKTAQIEALNEVYNKNLNAKHSIISQHPTDKVLRDHKQQMDMLEAEAEAVREAGGEINTTVAKSKTNKGVKVEFDAWKKEAEKKGNVRIAASEDGTQIYGAMTAVTNEAGEVVSYEIFMNEKNIFEDGKTTTASHELLHAAVFNTIRANPVLRRRFGEAIERILDGPGVKISPEARKDLDRVMQYGKTARGEELLAIVSENMVSGGITIDAGAIGKMKDLMRTTSMFTTQVDIEFNGDEDIRNFLKDYSKSRKKGTTDKRITSLFVKGAKGKLVETPATREEARKIVEERHEEQAKEDYYQTLMASMRATPDMKQEIDEIVKNPDGSRKYETKEQFNRRGGVEAAWMKLSQSPLLDGLIQQGMVEKGLPPQAMRDFTREVKEGLMERLYRQYDPAKNDSLFGWLTGVSGGAGRSQIYRAKGDVMNAYKDSNKLNTASLDAQIGDSTTFEAMIEAETDVLMEQLDEMNILARESDIVGPKKIVETIGLSETSVDQINTTVEAANLDITGLTYKSVKKLVTGKDAPLSNVLDVMSRAFGVDADRIVKPADLNGKQRTAAQEFIKENSQALLEMLPDGETKSGEATGVANTKLGDIYQKGERAKYAEGASASGKFTQVKRSDVSQAEFNAMFGIREDGTFDNNRKHDGAIKALVNQAAMVAANQSLRENAVKKGTHPMSTIALLGEGRSEIMFSKRIREVSTKNPELGVEIITRLKETDPTLFEASGRSVRAVMENRLGDLIERGDLKKGDVNAIVKDIEAVVNLFSNIPEGDVIEGGRPLFDTVVDRVIYNIENPRQYYTTVAKNRTGEDVTAVDLDNASHISLMETQVLKPLSEFLGEEKTKKLVFPAVSAAAKLGTGVNIRVNGEIVPNPNYDASRKNTDRKGLAANAAHANEILGTENVEISKEDKTPSIAYASGKKDGWTSSRVQDAVAQKDEINKAQREANEGFREIVDWLKAEYEAKRISAGQVIALLESFNSNPAGLTRMAAIFDFAPTKPFKGKATLEHMTPALMVNLQALDYILSGNDSKSKQDFTDIMDNYRTAFLPEAYDKLINEHYKSRMPSWWTPDMPPLIRYYNPETYHKFDLELVQLSTGDVVTNEFVVDQKVIDRTMAAKRAALNGFVAKDASDHDVIQAEKVVSEAMFSKRTAEPKGISVLDFDDTLATTKSNVLYTTPDGKTGKLNAEEFAKQGGDLLAQGAKFDFSEFNKVIGGKTAPLFNKAMKLAGKFGTDNMFILTARTPESATAIKAFLDAQGLDIPIENITGLGKSEAEAKALWIAEKVGEGYNDFYFADDAIQNVRAVKDILDQFDVKGKVQQARVEFSKRAPKKMAEIINEGAADLNKEFNITLEQTKGVKAEKTFSPAKARQRGKDKGKYKFFIPPSADDFAGLMYSFLGKGKQGEKHHAWFKKHLFDPYSKAIRHLNAVQTIVAGDMRALKKAMPGVKNLLKKTIPGTEYTNEHAVRVYNWVKAGLAVPGLSQADTDTLVKKVENNADLKQFAETVSSIAQMPGGLQQAGNDWLAGNVTTDLKDALDIARGTYLDQWKNNVKVIFNDANMNKIEAVYGSNFREALEDSLFRMETGSNRSKGQGRLLNNFMNWINGSIGATMFFNSRSAVLQTLSTVNFINWSDNNPLKAAAAFGNQKQYWSDMVMIFNSDFLKQRRSGLTQDVNTAELAEAIRGAANPARAAMGYLLQIGFTPTQVADSFAIASGGATFYRNRIKSLQEKGMNKAEAENQAFLDFMEIAEETQQSARPDRISQQQASPLGKLILAFQNTPMQYNRLIKKAAQDLVNGRGDAKTHISKILYYGAIQNAIFYSLQTALFAMMFGDDDDDEEERQGAIDKKTSRVMNGMVDGILRGAGIGGAVVSTLKNVLLQHLKQKEKLDDGKFYTDYKESEVIIELLNLSPPIGIKARKISSGLKTWLYNRDVIDHMSKTDIDNPIYDATFSIVEGLTNLPLGRAHDKLMNLREAADSDHETWKRVAMFLGWNKWSFGIQNQSLTDAKGEVRDLKDAATEKRREERKVEREREREEEDQKVEDENLEIQEEERAQGKEDILCAAVNRAGKRCGTKVVEGKNFCTIHEEAEQRTDGAKKQCSHVKSDGKRCKMQTSNKSGLCYYHD